MNLKAKYNKVKVLSEKGATEGERQAAKEALKRMEEKYPELVPSTFVPNHDPTTGQFQNRWGESFVKGYQANIEFIELDEASVFKKVKELFRKSGKVIYGVDWSSGNDFTTTNVYRQRPDGIWEKVE